MVQPEALTLMTAVTYYAVFASVAQTAAHVAIVWWVISKLTKKRRA